MSNTNDFIIENGVLKEYLGKDKKIKEKVANKLCETIITILKDELDKDTKKEC